jgi:hypothetical protein
MNSKYNTPNKELHEYSIPGRVQLENTHKNVTPTTLSGGRQAKKNKHTDSAYWNHQTLAA